MIIRDRLREILHEHHNCKITRCKKNPKSITASTVLREDNACFRIVSSVLTLEAAGQGIIFASQALHEKDTDTHFSFVFQHKDAVTVSAVFLVRQFVRFPNEIRSNSADIQAVYTKGKSGVTRRKVTIPRSVESLTMYVSTRTAQSIYLLASSVGLEHELHWCGQFIIERTESSQLGIGLLTADDLIQHPQSTRTTKLLWTRPCVTYLDGLLSCARHFAAFPDSQMVREGGREADTEGSISTKLQHFSHNTLTVLARKPPEVSFRFFDCFDPLTSEKHRLVNRVLPLL
ncbi:unnamed protein product [Schistocephalus solidus]|uniref:Uncharacterized protein n=1 Tax=Schistocephalus solidus TaxID=70667 RepID=A0A183TQL2_SCHSO|nr:unnamed protein product [Schistocephalus solidus]